LSYNESDEEIYAADNKSILDFDWNLKLINKIGNSLNYVWFFSIDQNILYISHLEDDKIGLWDIQKLKLIKEKKLKHHCI
jgi:WD40 repeat protein